MHEISHQQRLKQILDRLEVRSIECPGLFPVISRSHWQQLALLHKPECQYSVECLWRTLESFDRDPQLAHIALNRLLARQSAVTLLSVKGDAKETAQRRCEAIAALLGPHDSSCQTESEKTA